MIFLKIIQIQFSHLQKVRSTDKVQIQLLSLPLICLWNRSSVYFQIQAHVSKLDSWDIHSVDYFFFLNFLQDFEIFSQYKLGKSQTNKGATHIPPWVSATAPAQVLPSYLGANCGLKLFKSFTSCDCTAAVVAQVWWIPPSREGRAGWIGHCSTLSSAADMLEPSRSWQPRCEQKVDFPMTW